MLESFSIVNPLPRMWASVTFNLQDLHPHLLFLQSAHHRKPHYNKIIKTEGCDYSIVTLATFPQCGITLEVIK